MENKMKEIEMTKTTKTLAESINDARANFGAIQKKSINPHFKSKYADLCEILDAVTNALAGEGVLLSQPILDGMVYTRLSKGDEVIESSLPLPAISDPQKVGSAITYYRRYTLSSLLALAAEDDDGNVASEAPKMTPAKPVQTPPVPTTSITKDGDKINYKIKSKKEAHKEVYKYDLSSVKMIDEKYDKIVEYLDDFTNWEMKDGNQLISIEELPKLKNYEVK